MTSARDIRDIDIYPEQLTFTMAQTLVAVRDHGSIGAAARALGKAQPTISQTLGRFEEIVGEPLVRRDPHGTVITATGILIATYAEQFVGTHHLLVQEVLAARHKRHSTTNIRTLASSYTVAENLLPTWLATSKIRANVEVMNSRQVQEAVCNGEADIGFVEGRTIDPTLEQCELGREQLVVAMSSSHPLAHQPDLSVMEMLSSGLVVREAGSGVREVIEVELSRRGWALPASVQTYGSTMAVLSAVASSERMTIVSPQAAHALVMAGKIAIKDLRDLDSVRVFRAVWHPTRPPERHIQALIDNAKTALGNQILTKISKIN